MAPPGPALVPTTRAVEASPMRYRDSGPTRRYPPWLVCPLRMRCGEDQTVRQRGVRAVARGQLTSERNRAFPDRSMTTQPDPTLPTTHPPPAPVLPDAPDRPGPPRRTRPPPPTPATTLDNPSHADKPSHIHSDRPDHPPQPCPHPTSRPNPHLTNSDRPDHPSHPDTGQPRLPVPGPPTKTRRPKPSRHIPTSRPTPSQAARLALPPHLYPDPQLP